MIRFGIRALLLMTLLAAVAMTVYVRTRPAYIYRNSFESQAFRQAMYANFPNGSSRAEIEAALGPPNTSPDAGQVSRYKSGRFREGYEIRDEFIAYKLVEDDGDSYACVLQFRNGRLVNTSHYDWNPNAEPGAASMTTLGR